MKAKYLCLAIPVCLLLSLAMSGVASAESVYTEWEFNGPGEIDILTEKPSGAGSWDSLHMGSSGSGSSGWQNVSATPHGYAWCGTNFKIERRVEITGGTVDTYTVRENPSYTYWPVHTEYGAHIEAGSDGYGKLRQSFYNTYSSGGMQTYLDADCPYQIGARVDGTIGGSFHFDIGAGGDGAGQLYLNVTDRPEHNGYRLMWGDFGVNAESNAGFNASWGTLADFDGFTRTPSLTTYFDADVSGSGFYNKCVSAAKVIIEGIINALK